MVDGFDPRQQQPGSNSCLPTAITAILRFYGRGITEAQVSVWCQEGPDGCVIDLAMDGLRDNDCDVIELTDNPEAAIRDFVNDAEDPTPVLVTIKPAFSMMMDHAVVVLGAHTVESGEEVITLMDPLSGRIETMASDLFFQQWDSAGQLAFIIRT